MPPDDNIRALDQPRILLTPEDVSKRTNLSRSTVYNEISSGRLRAIRVGARRMLRPEDVEAWVDALPQHPTG